MTHQEVWAGLSGKQTTSSLLLVPPPNSVPLGTDAPDEQQSKPQPLPDGEEDSVVLKYSDPFTIQPEVDLYMQRLPTGIPATGSDRDVMLLYQDSISDGPQSAPPAMATEACCPNCGCRLTASGNCPDGRCPLPQRGQPQFDNGGGGLFPSLPQRREPDERLLPRPQELLREAFPLPTFANVLPWLIVAGFAIYLALRFAQSRFDAAVRRATDQTTSEPKVTRKPRTTSNDDLVSDMLQRGQTWLSAKLTRFASQRVIYQRDELSVELPATIGKSEYEQDDGEGVITRAQVRDFLINTKDLLGSVIGTWPRRGDRILETDGDTTFVYELMSIGNEPPWRYSDPFRVKLRIHTKLVDTIT